MSQEHLCLSITNNKHREKDKYNRKQYQKLDANQQEKTVKHVATSNVMQWNFMPRNYLTEYNLFFGFFFENIFYNYV